MEGRRQNRFLFRVWIVVVSGTWVLLAESHHLPFWKGLVGGIAFGAVAVLLTVVFFRIKRSGS
jgi:hypothetical protein